MTDVRAASMTGPVPIPAGPGAAASPGLPVPRRHVAIAALSLGTILTTIDGPIVGVALPTLARDLHVDGAAVVLVVTIYQLVLVMALLPCSALGERIGNRMTYQCGQGLFLAATILCCLAPNLPLLVLARGLQALGAAAVLSVGAALVRGIYPSDRLGRGLALNTVVAALSSTVAPTIGGLILAVARWPWLFAVVVPFGALSLLLGRSALPDSQRHAGAYDFTGAALCAAMFGLGAIGLESIVRGQAAIWSAALVVLGVALGWFVVRRERRQARPVFPVDLLRRRTVSCAVAASLLAYTGTMLLMLALPFALQRSYGYSAVAAGAVLAPLPLVVTVVAPIAGMLSDRVPAGLLGAAGMAITALGMGMLGLLPPAPGHLNVAWRVAVAGFGQALFFTPMARHIVAASPSDRAAAAGALTSLVRGLGQTLGATGLAALLAIGIGHGAAAAWLAAGLAVVAGLLGLASLDRAATPRGADR